MKNQITSYFNFSKKELNGILVLFIILSLIFGFPYCYRFIKEPEVFNVSEFKDQIAVFKASATRKNRSYKKIRNYIEDKELNPVFFTFDPNGLSESDWQRLGLSAKQSKVIKNYEAKGGRFYKNEDLKKIFSITESQYATLEPYIRIKSDKPKAFNERKFSEYKKEYAQPKREVAIIEINSADSITLESIRGIGPAFASRIIRFRDRLGGYYSKEQLKEVYGMDSLKYAQLSDQVSADVSLVQKINLNTATFEQMKRHPYLNYKQINAMIQYRKQHGNFQSADDLKKVLILNEEIIRKIEPYISF